MGVGDLRSATSFKVFLSFPGSEIKCWISNQTLCCNAVSYEAFQIWTRNELNWRGGALQFSKIPLKTRLAFQFKIPNSSPNTIVVQLFSTPVYSTQSLLSDKSSNRTTLSEGREALPGDLQSSSLFCFLAISWESVTTTINNFPVFLFFIIHSGF